MPLRSSKSRQVWYAESHEYYAGNLLATSLSRPSHRTSETPLIFAIIIPYNSVTIGKGIISFVSFPPRAIQYLLFPKIIVLENSWAFYFFFRIFRHVLTLPDQKIAHSFYP